MAFTQSILFALIASVAIAVPTIDFPLNAQVPTIARVSQPFSYTYPKSTFSSTSSITYTLSNGPRWLTLDGSTRTLFGTPSVEDIGQETVTGVLVGITAKDKTGSSTMNSTIIVSRNPPPTIDVPTPEQLSTFGRFSAPSTLTFHPSTPFEFAFNPSTFAIGGNNTGLSYYAVTDEHTPMPSWIKFDGASLTFNGQTPDYASLIQPPQTFGIKLIASDVEGFEGAALDFNIEVGVHQLSFKRPLMTINTTAGNEIVFNGLKENIEIDERVANSSSIVSISVDTPQWLTFDNKTLVLSGVPPSDTITRNLTVTALDIYGDTANATIFLQPSNPIFNKKIPTLNGTIGSTFKYNLSMYLNNPADVDLDIGAIPTKSWVSLDSTALELRGDIPSSANSGDIEITLTATSRSTKLSETQVFPFTVQAASQPFSPSSTTSSQPTSTSTQEHPSAPGSQSGASASRRPSNKAILAVVIPIVCALLALLLALFCYRKRRRDKRNRPKSPSKSEISIPIECHSSVEEIVLPPPVAKPPTLELDTSTFAYTTFTHGLTTNERRFSKPHPSTAIVPQDKAMRRSQTVSGDGVERRSQIFAHAASQDALNGNTGGRVRSYSENALSKTSKDSSWRSTQSSNVLGTQSSQTLSSHRITRTYSNYSRKGHTRRSARVLDAKTVGDIRDMPNVMIIPNSSPLASTTREEPSILGLNDSDFSLTPLDNFSVLGKSPILEQPDIEYIPEGTNNYRSITRRGSRHVAGFERRRRSGMPHGVRGSGSMHSIKSTKRRSIGHGSINSSSRHRSRPSLARNSRTWLTVATNEVNSRPLSNISAPSSYSELYPEAPFRPRRMTVRAVTKSPSICSPVSSRNSRPVSRRVGSSPFFGGGSVMGSQRRKSSMRKRTSYADSPTVSEEGGVFTGFQGMNLEDQVERDSFGISYGLAREGTRQLRSFIQGQLRRSRTRGSMESRDSRFDSATTSILAEDDAPELGTHGLHGFEEFENGEGSEGSWETHYPSPEDAPQENEDDGERPLTARMGWKGRPLVVEEGMRIGKIGLEEESSRGRGKEGEMRVMSSLGKRPVSVDARRGDVKGSVRGRVEGASTTQRSGSPDWSAYI
ncbi:Cadherin-like protein [Glarea lozoyensis ATCC 20868]|uniref:Cadherin-like protein n=1 Tax=Glarea lozoyensis (strain ATCC 20868 / MF5171) TaxID=1116229 RepID=S3E851_GLAL2|nr:Cadherin-like protein [Glarea lozoyensis ATCC 20868]EPE34518.1 Cadherin-like protein [Glarea lozoyensis ATCC 20868]